ncbi:hypothetical protein [Streptomyces agglomeratus]|uniref:hypothetical protein n=1 Tax=Streptomyces agglomeratus TaxID=285458 RepID=UPI000A4957F4|nr:hypothetical protein [Streptomyces agglomeratus]
MIKQSLTVDEVVGVADRYAALGFETRGDLGQHFLRIPDAAHALLERAGIPAGAHVLEVGAGLGTLSSAIATAGHLSATTSPRSPSPLRLRAELRPARRGDLRLRRRTPLAGGECPMSTQLATLSAAVDAPSVRAAQGEK